MGINRHNGQIGMIESATPAPSAAHQGPRSITGSTRALAQRSRDQRRRREERLRPSWRERWSIRFGLAIFFALWFLIFATTVLDYLTSHWGR